MIETLLTFNNPSGLHARPASMFVSTCKRFSSNIKLNKDGQIVNAKSLMAVLMLGIRQGDQTVIIIDGEDEQQALTELEQLINNNLGEITANKKRLIRKAEQKYSIKEYSGDGSGVGIFYFNGEIYHSFANHMHAVEKAAEIHNLSVDDITEMEIEGKIPMALGYMHNSIKTIVFPSELRNTNIENIIEDILTILPEYEIIED